MLKLVANHRYVYLPPMKGMTALGTIRSPTTCFDTTTSESNSQNHIHAVDKVLLHPNPTSKQKHHQAHCSSAASTLYLLIHKGSDRKEYIFWNLHRYTYNFRGETLFFSCL